MTPGSDSGATGGSATGGLVLEIAGLRIGLASAHDLASIGLGAAYRKFAVAAAADLLIDIDYCEQPVPDLSDHELVFESGALWSYHRSEAEHLFVVRSPNAGPVPYRLGRFDPEFRRGRISSTPSGIGGVAGPLLPDPLEYPLGELLTICLLDREHGLLAHACGVDDRGNGYLFCGQSGAGKTTLARLWRDAARILNDDRVALRPTGDRCLMYGTPWHGDLAEVSAVPTSLSRLFFINHAERNSCRPLPAATAGQLLLARCFAPFWSVAAMERTLAVIDEIVGCVPAFELGVVPTAAIKEVVRCAG